MVALNLKEWSNSYPPMADITRESICEFAVRIRAGFERVIEQHFGLGLTSSSIFTHTNLSNRVCFQIRTTFPFVTCLSFSTALTLNKPT